MNIFTHVVTISGTVHLCVNPGFHLVSFPHEAFALLVPVVSAGDELFHFVCSKNSLFHNFVFDSLGVLFHGCLWVVFIYLAG